MTLLLHLAAHPPLVMLTATIAAFIVGSRGS